MTKKERKYKVYCKLRYYGILIIYAAKTVVELYFADYAFTGMWFYISIFFIIAYFIAKWYQLKNMKFRKRNFGKRRKR